MRVGVEARKQGKTMAAQQYRSRHSLLAGLFLTCASSIRKSVKFAAKPRAASKTYNGER